ncbi:MAG: rhodanese-related sulfurtransferase [Crocinitomicaceae bacterium]
MPLWNIFSKEELEKQLRAKGHEYTLVSFYQYAKIEDPQAFRNALFSSWTQLDILGRTYIAKEGINAQIAVPTPNFEAFQEQLYAVPFLNGIRLNVAVDSKVTEFPFLKLKIKVRDKILADGLNDETFDVTNKGKHLNAQEFNALTDKSDCLLVDFRNHYEHEVGHFKDAILPDVDTFRDSLPLIEEDILKGNEDKNVIMYCTGGIRCEKASAWFKHRGFNNVYQLNGGIIKYANECKEQGLENKFIGKNFVFDERRAERVTDAIISQCHQCGAPCDDHTNCAFEGCHLLFIQCETCKNSMDNCCSDACKEIIQLPEEQQRAIRQKVTKSNLIFKKGRSEALKFKGMK